MQHKGVRDVARAAHVPERAVATPEPWLAVTTPRTVQRRAAGILAVTVVLVALGDLTALVARHAFGITEVGAVLGLRNEQSLGTWVNTLLLAVAGAAAALNGAVAARLGGQWVRNWWLLGGVLALLSIDEVVGVHDRAMLPLREALTASGVLYYAWIVPAMAVTLVFLLLQVRFLRALGRPTGLGLFLAGAVFVGGAVGLEMVEGLLAEAGQAASLAYDVAVLVEETAEIGSVAWAAHLLLGHLLSSSRSLEGWVPGTRDETGALPRHSR